LIAQRSTPQPGRSSQVTRLLRCQVEPVTPRAAPGYPALRWREVGRTIPVGSPGQHGGARAGARPPCRPSTRRSMPTTATTRAAPGPACWRARRRSPASSWSPRWTRSGSTAHSWSRPSPCTATTPATRWRCTLRTPTASRSSSRSTPATPRWRRRSPRGRPRRARSACASCSTVMSPLTRPIPGFTVCWRPPAPRPAGQFARLGAARAGR